MIATIATMPTISRFLGIVITMHWERGAQHHAAHFHARYAGQQVSVAIDSLAVLQGGLPPRAFGLVLEWALAHRQELLDNWARMLGDDTPVPIEPLA